MLARLVNDLQWRYIVNEAKRRYSKLITRRTATLSVIALIIFVTIVMVLATRRATFTYGDLRLLWIAGLAGTWGATFSMLASLRTRLDQSKFDDLKLMKAGSVLLSRAAVGAGAASILFFFLLSGLLGGTAFPILTRSEESRRLASGTTMKTPSGPLSTPTSSAPSPAAPGSTGTSTLSSSPTPVSPTGSQGATPPAAPASQKAAPPAAGASDTQPQQQSLPAQTQPPTTAKPESAQPDRTTTTATTEQATPVAEDNTLPTRELAMLIVWCFIAGFSEQLIPGLLASTEARAGAAPTAGTTDRFRPTTGTMAVPPPAGAAPQATTVIPPAGSTQQQTPPQKDQGEPKKT